MGRRTRKRVVSGAAPPRGALAVRGRPHEAPRAPWGRLPLVEAAILAGIACIVIGFARGAESSGWLIALGFGLVSVASLELAVREHLAGYRSHSALLAGALAVAVAAAALVTGIPQEAVLVLAVVVGGVALPALRGVFRRRSGGLGLRA